MKSLFTHLFSNLFVSSFVVLIAMITVSFIAIKYSVQTWNTSKKADLECITSSLIIEICETDGFLDGAVLYQALEPYLLNSLYLFIFDQNTQPILLLDKEKPITLEEFNLIIGDFQDFFLENPLSEIMSGQTTVAKLLVRK